MLTKVEDSTNSFFFLFDFSIYTRIRQIIIRGNMVRLPLKISRDIEKAAAENCFFHLRS